jgi:hypothetical protein
MMFLGLLLSAASAPLQSSEPDPLLPARTGRLQCYAPDAAHKTCGSLAGYRADGAGRYLNRAEIPLTPDGSLTMTITTPVRIVSGAVCGPIRAEDIARAEVRIAGTPMAAGQAAPLLARVAQAFGPLIGHEICTRYEPEADGFVSRASLDGIYRPDLDQRMIWVDPADGYRVARQLDSSPSPEPTQSPG